MNPLVLIAELTHRCPLRCAYCSNPRDLVPRAAELDTQTWIRVLRDAAELGVLQIHFTGGEPLLRDDLGTLTRAAADAGIYPTLITSGLGARARLHDAVRAGIRAVQVSFKETCRASSSLVPAAEGGIGAKGRRLAAGPGEAAGRIVRALGVSLTCNFVLHAGNLAQVGEFIELALELKADRVELAHTQFHGWAALNHEHLLPTRAQLDAADVIITAAKRRHAATTELVYVLPDLFIDRPKPCMGGWGSRAIVIDPAGTALPCHGARSLPLAHPNVREHTLAAIWAGETFSAFRGEAWMEEPCRSCHARGHDYGGCRCQAFALTGRVSATDPACRYAPEHARVVAMRERAERGGPRRSLQLRTRS